MKALTRLYVLALVFVFAVANSGLLAQTEKTTYRVVLKDGSVIRGTIEGDSTAQVIRLRLSGGALLEFQRSEVTRFSPDSTKTMFEVTGTALRRDNLPYAKNRRPYLTIMTGTGLSQSNFGTVARSSLGVSGGYRLFPQLGIGAGINLAGLPPFGGVSQFFGEINGNIGRRKAALYYEAQAGRGAVLNRGWNVTEFRGGLYALAGAGVSMRTFWGNEFHFTLAYVQQDAFLRYQQWDWNGNTVDVAGDRSFRQISFRFGFTF